MKSAGIVRRLDSVGRIALPVELRQTHGIKAKDDLAIFTDGDLIILRKYEPHCAFCDSTSQVIRIKRGYVCNECLSAMRQILI